MSASERREAILDAAQALFMQRGWEDVTVADVLGEAGISKGGFYHHFDAKDDLLTAIVARLTDRALDAAETARTCASGDALARLDAFIGGSLRWNTENPESLHVFAEVLVRPGNEVLFQRIFEATAGMIRPIMAEMIADGVEDGTFDVTDQALTAEMIVGLLQGRRRTLSRVLGAALAGDVDTAAAELDARLVAEGAICDRLLGLPNGSIAVSKPAEYRRMLAGLAPQNP